MKWALCQCFVDYFSAVAKPKLEPGKWLTPLIKGAPITFSED